MHTNTACIVAGLLYYHVARILLKMHKPISSMLSGFDAAKQRYEAEVCYTYCALE